MCLIKVLNLFMRFHNISVVDPDLHLFLGSGSELWLRIWIKSLSTKILNSKSSQIKMKVPTYASRDLTDLHMKKTN